MPSAPPLTPLRCRAPLLVLPLTLLLAVGCTGAGNPSDDPPSQERPPGVESPDPQSATGGRNAAAWLDAPYVILVSFDGFASRYLPALQPPTIAELASRGVHAPQGMIPAFPSKTFPNHYTLATGVWPANHGIVGNTFYDPQRDATYRISDRDAVEDGSWYQAEPLWVTAERQGMVAASFYWVGSEADVMGVRPSYWRTYDGEVPNRERVAQVLEWLRYPAEYRPHMITLYFSLVDAAGHSFGPQSPEVAEAVAEADTLVRELWEGIRALPHGDRVSLVVTSDHGMDGYGADNIEYVSDALGSLEGIRMPSAGPNGNLFVEGGPAEARRVRDAINAGLEHTTAHLGAEMPERFHYRGNPRIGDVVLVPDSGWVVYPEPDRPPRPGFTHGWDPAVRSMRALFFAVGHALPAGRTLPPFSITQVHPLVVRLLGLEPPEEIDGDLSFWDGVVGSAPVGSAPVGAANGG